MGVEGGEYSLEVALWPLRLYQVLYCYCAGGCYSAWTNEYYYAYRLAQPL